jgi:putative oxidoreductase
MEQIIKSGRYLYAVPIAVFGVMHFLSADEMGSKAPGGVVMVYVTGLALLLASIAIFIGKYDKLASILLGFMLLLFIFPHAQGISSNSTEIINILKNVAMAGGAFMCAANAKDNSLVN